MYRRFCNSNGPEINIPTHNIMLLYLSLLPKNHSNKIITPSFFLSFCCFELLNAAIFSCKKMMSLGSNGNSNTSTNFPFTATQWQELEHQALIYKYMISGLPIPPHLLFSVKRSLDSSLSSSLLLHPAHHHSIGWNNYEMSYGRKIDPEPGRCRRTDGKKWRCSKEAYTDSKYCERHMHRGRNRSRKHVEITTKPVPSSVNTQTTSSSLFSHSNPTSLSSMTFVDTPPSYDTNHLIHPYSSSSGSLGFDFSSQERDTDYRYAYGMKEETDEHSLFQESSGSVRDYSDSHSTLAHLKRNTSDSGYPSLHLNDSTKQHKQDQYFNIMDSEFHKEVPLKLDRDDMKPHQVMHHFFDELPKSRDSWEDKSSNYLGASTTQLSISTPNSSYDFFMSHNDK